MKGSEESLIPLLVLGLLIRRCWKDIKEIYGTAGIILAIIAIIIVEIFSNIFDI